VEGQTFRSPQLSAVLRDKVVESRLHMDFPGRIDPDKFPLHQRLQAELIGNPAMPYYAILDPETDEFLYRTYIRGGDFDLLRDSFLEMLEKLPDKEKKKG